MSSRFLPALAACATAMGLATAVAVLMDDLRVLVFLIFACAFVAGLVLGERGARTGFISVLLVSVAWALFALGTGWTEGTLGRMSQDCDGCVGEAGRIVVVIAVSIGLIGPFAGVAGWLGVKAARRAWPRPGPEEPEVYPYAHGRREQPER